MATRTTSRSGPFVKSRREAPAKPTRPTSIDKRVRPARGSRTNVLPRP